MASSNINGGNIIKNSQNWISANLAGDICLREALLEILHDPQNGLPKDGKLLCQRMLIFKKNHEQKLKKVIRKNQWDKICPPSGESNSDNWDVTIIKVVIQYEGIIPPPIGGWEIISPNINDHSKAADVCRAKDIRNELKHGTVQELSDDSKFEGIMQRIKNVLNCLHYSKINIFHDLKLFHFEAYNKQTVKLFQDTLSMIQDDIKDLKENKVEITTYKTKMNKLEELMQEFCSQVKDVSIKKEVYGLLTEVSIHQQEFENIKIDLKRLHDDHDDLKASQKKLKTDVDELKKNQQKNITSGGFKNIAQKKNEEPKKKTEKKDMEKSFQAHRKKILDLYNQQRLCNPVGNTSHKYIEKEREEIFVDLSIIWLHEDDVQKPECYRYLAQDAMRKKNITIKEVVQDKNFTVLIEGIAGIGKTQLVDTMALKWAKNQIFNGENGMPNIHVLLPIKCRELNTRNISPTDTNETILRKLYPKLFKDISLKDLKENDYNVMFIIDGLDELMSVEQIHQPNKTENPRQNRILHFMRDVIIEENGLLNKQYTVIAGRPTVINPMADIFRSSKHEFRKVIVCGFNKESVQEYIRKHCSEVSMQNKVKEEINSSEYLSAMAQIPVYTWVICNIYRDDLRVPSPRTTTELMIYACLVFIRNHLLDDSGDIKDLSLREICEREDVIKLILAIAKISFISLSEGKVVFEKQEMDDLDCNVDELERKLGFIVKTQNGEYGYFYQFTHLVLQEFFAAIHIFLSNDFIPIVTQLTREPPRFELPNEIKKDIAYTKANFFKNSSILPYLSIQRNDVFCLKNIDVCFPIICGLEGMDTQSNELLKFFVQRLKLVSEKKENVEISLMKQMHWLQHEKYSCTIPSQCFIDFSNNEIYLLCCFENGCELPEYIALMLAKKNITANLPLSNNFGFKIFFNFLQKLSVYNKGWDDIVTKTINNFNMIKNSGATFNNTSLLIRIGDKRFNCNYHLSDSLVL